MSTGGAQFFVKQFIDDNGTPYGAVKVYHYAAGTSTDKDVWLNESKTTTAPQPFVGDSKGMVVFYGDGDYRLKIEDSEGNALYDWDGIKITSDTGTIWEGNRGTSYPSSSALNRGHLFGKEDVSGNLTELGYNDVTGFRSTSGLPFPAYAKASLPVVGTAGLLSRVTDDVRGLWMDQASQWFALNKEIVNVKEFGATGDGTTDDTSAIQAAIDSVTNGIIFMPPGTYILTDRIRLKSEISLVGSGKGATTISRTSGSFNMIETAAPDQYTSRSDRVAIRDLTINGAGSGLGSGIRATHTHYSLFENIDIDSCEYGVYFDYSWTNDIRNVLSARCSKRNWYFINQSHALTLTHIYSAGGTTSIDSPPIQFEVNLCHNMSIHGATYENGFTDKMIYIHNCEGYNHHGIYLEIKEGQFIGNSIIHIGSPSDTVFNAGFYGGRIMFRDATTSTTNKDVVRIENGNGIGGTSLIRFDGVMIWAGAAFNGDFFDIGEDTDDDNDTRFITLIGNFTSGSGGSPVDLRVRSKVVYFTEINNYWAHVPLDSNAYQNNAYRFIALNRNMIYGSMEAFADGDGTPAVDKGNLFETNNSSVTTISDFTREYEGQTITVIFTDPNTTVNFAGSNLKGNAGADWAPQVNDHMVCTKGSTYWHCVVSNNA
jgi:hypothetical protein